MKIKSIIDMIVMVMFIFSIYESFRLSELNMLDAERCAGSRWSNMWIHESIKPYAYSSLDGKCCYFHLDDNNMIERDCDG